MNTFQMSALLLKPYISFSFIDKVTKGFGITGGLSPAGLEK